mmetsp:Transcript_60418/g.140721  ORF Transcript_60418/g.140721 Transcript_60418/m.140721 type:complete len:140 (-) Transcript_60418:115-534(-)|eukprot:CAMPEP_0171090684 /NCGR_PEP_ID=MMETSP0766_2-20121228/32008_1 /TAXON_ID=439317 /ORGANISM="Gambierdiscus australes, Strain CAWD 149" /LENGTH=139 /DNA_ID=CAMNT_0011548707 /DNA_START=61 /DNA_END=480 /DNA_ORIENTATION=+
MSAVKGKILKAEGLKNVDWIGKSDPFVQITLEKPDGSVVGEAKTATKTDDLNPVWEDESFNFSYEGDEFLETAIRCKVMDTGLGPDVELGQVFIPVKLVPLMEEGTQQLFHCSLGIHGKKSMGTLTLSLGVVPAPSIFG